MRLNEELRSMFSVTDPDFLKTNTDFVKIRPKLRIFYFIGSFLEGQNCVQKNRGLLNKVAGTNQLDFVKAENVLPGASLINCENHFFVDFFLTKCGCTGDVI